MLSTRWRRKETFSLLCDADFSGSPLKQPKSFQDFLQNLEIHMIHVRHIYLPL